MFFAIITLITALALAGTAAAFAVLGIMAIFSGLSTHAMIMGIVIELGKIVAVSWVYRHWEERTVLKYLMIPFIIMAMLLTSMGVFGLLSRAYIEQSTALDTNTVMIQRLDERIDRERRVIADAELLVDQLDQTVNTLIQFNRISGPDGARAVREGQQAQRDELSSVIVQSNQSLDSMLDERATSAIAIQNMEREVGPVMFIAELVYSDEVDIDQAVRWVIIAFIFVFDPMAIMLLMAANYSLMARGIYLERSPDSSASHPGPQVPQDLSEPVSQPEPEPQVPQDLSEPLPVAPELPPADWQVALINPGPARFEIDVPVELELSEEEPPRPAATDENGAAEFVGVIPESGETPEHFVGRLLESHPDPSTWFHNIQDELASDTGVIARNISQDDAQQLIDLARQVLQDQEINLGRLGKRYGVILRKLKEDQ